MQTLNATFFLNWCKKLCDQSHLKSRDINSKKALTGDVNGWPHFHDILLHPLKQMGFQGQLVSAEMNEIPQLLAHWHRNGLDSVAEAFLWKQRRSQSYPVPSAHQGRPIPYRIPCIPAKATFSIDDTLQPLHGNPEDLISY